MTGKKNSQKPRRTASPELLRKLYLVRRMTQAQIAQVLNCHPTSISNWLATDGTPARQRGRPPVRKKEQTRKKGTT